MASVSRISRCNPLNGRRPHAEFFHKRRQGHIERRLEHHGAKRKVPRRRDRRHQPGIKPTDDLIRRRTGACHRVWPPHPSLPFHRSTSSDMRKRTKPGRPPHGRHPALVTMRGGCVRHAWGCRQAPPPGKGETGGGTLCPETSGAESKTGRVRQPFASCKTSEGHRRGACPRTSRKGPWAKEAPPPACARSGVRTQCATPPVRA